MKAIAIIIIMASLSGCAGYGGKASVTYGQGDKSYGVGYEWYRLPKAQKGGGK
jgi:hypothetical protein